MYIVFARIPDSDHYMLRTTQALIQQFGKTMVFFALAITDFCVLFGPVDIAMFIYRYSIYHSISYNNQNICRPLFLNQ